MGKVCEIFSSLSLLIAVCGSAFGGQIDSDKYGGVWHITDDTVVAAGVTRQVDGVLVEKSLFLENNGQIFGDVHVCDGCVLSVKNTGAIHGGIYADGATVTQVVTSVRDMQPLDVVGGFKLLLDGARDIDVHDMLDLGAGADGVVLRNTLLVLAGGAGMGRRMRGPRLEIDGIVTLRIQGDAGMDGAPLLSNVWGDGTIVLDVANSDGLYTPHGFISGGDLYFQMRRETDYMKVLPGPVGAFLNLVREAEPNAELIGALDAATTMDQINNLLRRSVRLRPLGLMRALNVFDTMVIAADRYANTGPGIVIGARPEYVTSDDFTIWASRFDVTGRFSDAVRARVGMVVGTLDATDGFDKFVADFYGAYAGLDLDGRYMFARFRGAAYIADFETPVMFDGRGAFVNPRGRAYFGVADVGARFDVGGVLRLGPFVGAERRRDTVKDISKDTAIAHVGMDASCEFATGDVAYDYGVRIVGDAHGGISADGHVGFHAPYDSFGGDMAVGFYHDEYGDALKLSLGLRYYF